MIFWTVQAFGIITLVLYVLSMQMKRKESLLILQVFSNLFFVFSCLLTNSPTGAALAGISIVRGGVFYIYKKRGLNPNITTFIIFQTAILTSTVFTWEGILSLFAFSANSTNMFAQWQDKMTLLRILTIASCVLWMIYQFSAGMYAAMISEVCIIASSAAALWKFRKIRNKEQI
jgi:hypothetical protein